MDPLSITAATVGITTPAVHCIRLLLEDLQKIVDTPDTFKSLKNDLLLVDQALTSLQASKTAATSYKESCDRFRIDLSRWTRHSKDGKLALQDRAMVGFFKQGCVKSISEQLQNCKITFTSAVSIATLHSSLQQTQVTEEMMATISRKEAEIAESITATDKQLAEVHAKLGALYLAKTEADETEADRTSAISQVAVEQTVLRESRKLLEELLSGIHTAAANARKDRGQIVNNFGDQNEGMQIGVSYGAISGITFGKK
ncbi:hypothetical protein QBC36DRAFT_341567 [Triangularia setosa]|uniref:Azaphilone pigments biosynthesis cluster protein L N-terminal domain-containing protein n=1 Tax=Triangularia setosa TaxID=2587417 RepID=A0AAN7A337_9PEZI|nr:hypothetical protein QBC36DRAFT_341567 [Podospora setosa]